MYFNSIHELSIYSWRKIREHKHFGFLHKSNSDKKLTEIEKDETIEGYEVYSSMIDELYSEFGQSEDLKKEIKLSKKLNKLCLKYIKTMKRSLLNDIFIVQQDLKKLQSKHQESTTDYNNEDKALVQEFGRFDPRKTSVYQYHFDLNLLQNGN